VILHDARKSAFSGKMSIGVCPNRNVVVCPNRNVGVCPNRNLVDSLRRVPAMQSNLSRDWRAAGNLRC
jgi:hypothetical protein